MSALDFWGPVIDDATSAKVLTNAEGEQLSAELENANGVVPGVLPAQIPEPISFQVLTKQTAFCLTCRGGPWETMMCHDKIVCEHSQPAFVFYNDFAPLPSGPIGPV